MVAGNTAASTLISTKLNPPRLSQDFTPRPRLVDKLRRNLHRKLTLVCAPAGYGKTTLVVSWLQETDRACAWLSLDQTDDNLLVFLRYLVAAVRGVDPNACARIRDLLYANQTPADGVLVATLINDLSALQQSLVLVLNDYHLLGNERIDQCLNTFVDQLPLQIHLVLISRVDPPLPLHSLRAGDMLGEIRAADLRFTPAEAEHFLRSTLPVELTGEELALLNGRTEGWIAGLRLASLSLQQQSDPSRFVRDFAGHADAFISDYLLHEVLARQPKAIRDFLLHTSILDSFCASLCDAVLDRGTTPLASASSSQELLEQIYEANLFLVSLDGARGWYRFHHLFQELLQSYLNEHVSSAELSALHARAAAWFRREGQVEEAVRHSLAAGDVAAAAVTVEDQLQTALNGEERFRVERWLSLLPQAIISERPELLVAQAWGLHWAFRPGDYMPLLDRAEALAHQPGPEQSTEEPAEAVNLAVLGQIDALRSQTLFFANRFDDSLACAERALARLPDSCTFVRRIASICLMLSLQALGRGEKALAFADDALRRSQQPRSLKAGILLAKVFNLSTQGQLNRVQLALEQLLRLAEEANLRLSVAWAHYHLGVLYFERDEVQSAVFHLRQAIATRYLSHVATYREALACLTLCFVGRGLIAEAEGTLAQLRAFAQERGTDDHYAVLHATEARVQLQRGQVDAALATAAFIDQERPLQPLLTFDVPQLLLARVLIAEGSARSLVRAEALLKKLHDHTLGTHDVRFQIAVLALRALLNEARGDLQQALAELEKAVLLARPGGFVRTFVEMGPSMAALLRHLASRGTEPAYINRLLAAFPEHSVTVAAQDRLAESLTDQEVRVLHLLQSRRTNKEIAKTLFISPNTVKRHTINLYRKLDVKDRHEAVTRAEALGLLPVT